MNIVRARRLASMARSNIGTLLHQLMDQKKNPANHAQTRGEYLTLLSVNITSLRSLYTAYPEIKPIRTRQLSFKKDLLP